MSQTLRALTLTQPWATLVALQEKMIETRVWRTAYRGEIAVHAAKGFPDAAREFSHLHPFSTALGSEILHTGKIVALATLTECFRFDERTESLIRKRSEKRLLPRFEVSFGDFSSGRYGFVLHNIKPLREPIPARGMLNLWAVPDDIAAAVRAQLELSSRGLGQ